MNFNAVTEFEKQIANYFGSPYAIAIDSCTHGIELCLRLNDIKKITIPKRTYLSIPFLAHKLKIELQWKDENWLDYYYLTDNIIDAAVYWKRDGYIPNTLMCLSFQYKKHLNVGRGGMILTDNRNHFLQLKKMRYEIGRAHV